MLVDRRGCHPLTKPTSAKEKPGIRTRAARLSRSTRITYPPTNINASPYALAGPRLVDQGFSAIVIKPDEKRPGAYVNRRWFGDLGWDRYSTRLPTPTETEAWTTWPGAGVGIVLGDKPGTAIASTPKTATSSRRCAQSFQIAGREDGEKGLHPIL